MYRSYHASSSEDDENKRYGKRRRRARRQQENGEDDTENTEHTAHAPRTQKKPVKTALVAAVDILARQEYSEAKLREKLARKGYTEEEMDMAVARLKERHYLDDAAACQRQFDFLYHESRSSLRQIALKLRQRGFLKEDIDACRPKDFYEREKDAALRVLALKFPRGGERQKMMANLYQKGFDMSAAKAAVTEYQERFEES